MRCAHVLYLSSDYKTIGDRNRPNMRKKESVPWRKILYEKQDYPDNFIGPGFLQDLKKNGNCFPRAFTVMLRVLAPGLPI